MKKNLILILLGLLCLNVYGNEESSDSTEQVGHYASIGLDLRTAGTFDAVTSSGSSSILDVEFTFESGYSLGYEYRKTKVKDWGWSAGFIYSSKKDVDGLTINGSEFTVTGDPANVSMTSVYLNAIYKWNQFYIPFGITLNSITFNPSSSFDGTYESKAGFGFIFMFGYEINDKVLIEYGARSALWSLSTESSSGDITEYGTGALAISTLGLKYKFH